MFNPFDTVKSATYKTGEGCKDIFDIVSKSYLARNVECQAEIQVPADGAVIAVELPAGSRIVKEDDGSLTVDGNVIAYYDRDTINTSISNKTKIEGSGFSVFQYQYPK